VKISVAGRKPPRIEMLPLIDVVFLLLVFFIYAMLSMAVHRALPVALPQSETAEIDPAAGIAVSVTLNGAVSIDEQPVGLSRLAEVLRDKAAAKNRGVQVFADRRVEYQLLYSVLDEIKKAGISRISLQADSDGKP
jgi:biopolymer transport protein ExbD